MSFRWGGFLDFGLDVDVLALGVVCIGTVLCAELPCFAVSGICFIVLLGVAAFLWVCLDLCFGVWIYFAVCHVYWLVVAISCLVFCACISFVYVRCFAV